MSEADVGLWVIFVKVKEPGKAVFAGGFADCACIGVVVFVHSDVPVHLFGLHALGGHCAAPEEVSIEA